MRWHDAIRLAASGLRGGIVRTLLTILCFSVGVGTVLAVLTLGNAGEDRVEEEIANMGVNKVWIRATDDRHVLTPEDAAILEDITDAPACAGAYMMETAVIGGAPCTIQIVGFDRQMQQVHAPDLLEGRLFSEQDHSEGTPVCIVDAALASRIDGDPVGHWLSVGMRRFRVIGIVEHLPMQTAAGGATAILPLVTLLDAYPAPVNEITLSVQRGQDAQGVAKTALAAMPDGFHADTLADEINAAREVVRIFVMVLIAVAILCMLTGGIGVMNILLVSVRERKREIGLIKALGGTSAQVALLYLLEAAAYSICGGLSGVALGAAMTGLFATWIGLTARLDMTVCILVLSAASLLGLFFGAAPALKAAGLPPVEALEID